MGSYLSSEDLKDIGYYDEKDRLGGWDVLWCSLGTALTMSTFYLYHSESFW
jgi:hypothetical protein